MVWHIIKMKGAVPYDKDLINKGMGEAKLNEHDSRGNPAGIDVF